MEILDRIEESWLDKLIKLLTEHCRKHYWFKDNDVIDIDHDSVQFYLYYNEKRYFSIGVEKVISKEFWFIKELLFHDKIDLWKIQKLYRKSNENSTATYPILYDYTYDESLLMFLAIQDEPIDFLISVLK